MPTVNQAKVISYSKAQMYAIVDNINDYHYFLHGCVESFEQNRCENSVEGTLVLKAPGIKKSFTTLNTLEPNAAITINLLKGPFKSLHGTWSFEELGETKCKVSLSLEFEFNNKLLALAFGPLFSHLCNSLTNAFCQRAKELYGVTND